MPCNRAMQAFDVKQVQAINAIEHVVVEIAGRANGIASCVLCSVDRQEGALTVVLAQNMRGTCAQVNEQVITATAG